MRESPFYGVRALAKRLTDILIAGAALLLLSPLLLLVALGVRVTSPGPIIFRQKRYGLDGKSITVYKFRSMTVTEDGDSSYTRRAATRADAVRRVHPPHLARRTAAIAQCARGQHEHQGPRPHAVAVNEQYRRLIPATWSGTR